MNVTVSTRSVCFSPKTSTGLASLAILTFASQPGDRLVGDRDEAGRELDLDLLGGGVVALVGNAHVEALEPAGGDLVGLQRDVRRGDCRAGRRQRPRSATAVRERRFMFCPCVAMGGCASSARVSASARRLDRSSRAAGADAARLRSAPGSRPGWASGARGQSGRPATGETARENRARGGEPGPARNEERRRRRGGRSDGGGVPAPIAATVAAPRSSRAMSAPATIASGTAVQPPAPRMSASSGSRPWERNHSALSCDAEDPEQAEPSRRATALRARGSSTPAPVLRGRSARRAARPQEQRHRRGARQPRQVRVRGRQPRARARASRTCSDRGAARARRPG